jgi:hypothetical protein
MWHFIYRWIYRDVWCVAYGNWVAGVIGFGAAYFWKGRAWLHKHEEHQRKIAELHEHFIGSTIKRKGE